MVNRVTPGYKWTMMVFNAIAFYTSGQLAWMFYGFYNLIRDYFQVTDTQMGYIGTVTGLVMIVCWPLGGMIADKLPIRTCFVGAMTIATGIYVVNAFITSFWVYLAVVFASCLLVGTLYGLCAKVVKRLHTPDTESKGLGFLWSIYAVVGTGLGFAGSALVAQLELGGWKPLMFLFAGASAVATVGGLLLLKEEKLNDWTALEAEKTGKAKAFSIADVKKVLFMPELWVAGMVYHTMIMITAGGIYAVTMLQDIYLAPLWLVTAIGTVRAYLARAILAPTTGVIVDKTKNSMGLIRILVLLALAGCILFLATPVTPEYMWVAIVLVAVMTIGFGMQAPLWMTPVNDLRIPVAYHGTAVGVYNAIGCIADAYQYVLFGWLLSTFNDLENQVYTGFVYVYIFLAVIMVLCFVFSMILSKMIKKRNAMLDAETT